MTTIETENSTATWHNCPCIEELCEGYSGWWLLARSHDYVLRISGALYDDGKGVVIKETPKNWTM